MPLRCLSGHFWIYNYIDLAIFALILALCDIYIKKPTIYNTTAHAYDVTNPNQCSMIGRSD